ncbi:MAG: amidohydrolase family protein [Candidatus Obscuribacterales bacterium]|nr:amidohydrolase family protein [Candidatus Obscuribacterales bacterium]
MIKTPHIVDFHAHLMSLAGAEKLCPIEQQSPFFKYVVPVIEPIAQFTEPVHDRWLRKLAMHYRCETSRFVYSQLGQFFLMEALRLFKTHGLERLLQSMERQKIEHTVIYSLEPLTHTRDILELLSPYPNKFSVFGSVSHSEPDPCAYLEPLMRDKLIRGVKIHPMVGSYEAQGLFDAVKDYVALASDYGLPVAIHTGDIPASALSELTTCSTVKELEPLFKGFPSCRFIINHSGWESWRAAFDMATAYDNVFLETSWQPAKIIRRAVDKIGAGRVLFGSDFPMFQQWQALREVRRALTEKEFELVASRNGMELLGLDRLLLSKSRPREASVSSQPIC